MITPAHLQGLCQRLCEAARKETLNQSVLFVGKEGVGKFSLAMNVAKALLCENDMTACGKCESCREVERLRHPDFLLIFPFPNLRPESKKQTVFQFSDPTTSNARFSDETREAVEEFRQAKLIDPFALPNFEKKENIPVEVVKDLLRALSKKPLRGRRVVAVLEIEKMAFGATDLFLKTVEEPPRNTHLLLTTSQPDLLYPTLLSRTQRIKVPLVPEDQIMKILGERLNLDPGPSRYLARMAGGSPGAALNLAEVEITSKREKVLELFLKLLEEGELNSLLKDVGSRYSGFKARYDDIRLDFDIIESLIHDLHLIGDNNLDNNLINIDIKKELQKLKAPESEVLEIWSECCAHVRRACTVNNVSADAGMAFFYVSCSQAMQGLTKPKYTLP
jgi:hypothetical protein